MTYCLISTSCLYVQRINLQIKLRNETSLSRKTHSQMHRHLHIALPSSTQTHIHTEKQHSHFDNLLYRWLPITKEQQYN